MKTSILTLALAAAVAVPVFAKEPTDKPDGLAKVDSHAETESRGKAEGHGMSRAVPLGENKSAQKAETAVFEIEPSRVGEPTANKHAGKPKGALKFNLDGRKKPGGD